MKSAGCGKGGRPSGGVVTVNGSHIYTFPESYDGNTPMPLLLAFHAAGNGNDQLRNITKGSDLEKNFVMAFPKSKGSQWVLNTDSASVDQRYQELLSNYCIDTSRVFATGHSSGAQLITQFLCKGETRFKAVAPVASSEYCKSYSNPIPVLDIHGANDRERGNTSQDANGLKDLAQYRTSNGCSMESTPRNVATCMSGGTTVMPGCVDFTGCTQPLTFCSHNDPEYSSTNHGWPCFANKAMNDFFLALP
jgi:poly(3-hydroxybutyrate) depolymerase